MESLYNEPYDKVPSETTIFFNGSPAKVFESKTCGTDWPWYSEIPGEIKLIESTTLMWKLFAL